MSNGRNSRGLTPIGPTLVAEREPEAQGNDWPSSPNDPNLWAIALAALASVLAANEQGVSFDLTRPCYRRTEASRYLKERYGLSVAPATLAKLACIGGSPPFYRAGRIPIYPRNGLDDWAVNRLGPLLTTTSDTGNLKTHHKPKERLS
jgi:hypothetical protein